MVVYEKKFNLWSQAIKYKCTTEWAVVKLLEDCTIYMHALFDVKHRWYQDMVVSDNHRYKMFVGANQVIGKEQPYSAKVLTSEGFVNMGDLKLGDKVYGSDGELCIVQNIFEQGIKPVYRLTFDDGSWAECGMDHLWKVMKPTHKKKISQRYKENCYNRWSVMSLYEIIKQWGEKPAYHNKISIPVVEPIQFTKADLILHPYIVGVLLGDGTMSANFCRQITCDPIDIEIIKRVEELLPEGLGIVHSSYNRYSWFINSDGKHIWSKLFLASGLEICKTEDKFIPNSYLYSSVQDRIELLRGLMDTDGSAYKTGVCEFSSKSKQLAENLQFLVESLGGKASINIKEHSGYKKDGKFIDCGIHYRVIVSLYSINPFYLKRKSIRALVDKRFNRKERSLSKIEYVRDEQSRCILVDSYDNTYLTNNCIVTHNSYLLNSEAVYSLLKDYGYGFNQAIISKSLPQARYQMTRIRDMLRRGRVDWQEQVGSSDNIMILSVNHYYPNAGKWFNISRDDRYKYTNYLICAPNTEAALGYDLHKLSLDEFDWWDVDQRYTFNKILEPRTYATKGQINIYSNPNGKDRYMWELWNQKLPDKSFKWHRYSFNYWDSPNASKKEYDMLVSGKTRNEVETTLLGIFTSSEGAYFSEDEITRSYDKTLTEINMVGKQPFFFLDVGAKHDQSVLVGGYVEVDEENEKLVHLHIPIIHCYPVAYPLTRVAGVDVDDSDGWHYEKSVQDYLKEWSQDGTIPIFGVDATGNSGIIPLFQAINIYPEDVIFSGPVKSGMYQRFKYYMEKGLIHRIKSPEFEYQTSHLVMKKSKRGYLMIHHENEEDLDDTADAVAGLVYLTDSPNIVEPSVMII